MYIIFLHQSFFIIVFRHLTHNVVRKLSRNVHKVYITKSSIYQKKKMTPRELNALKPTNLTITNMEGKQVELSSLWKDRRVLLVFLRHFG